MTIEKSQQVILLSYHRVVGKDTFTGSISGSPSEFRFTDVSYQKMFEMVGEALRSAPLLRLVIQREESTAVSASTLSASMEEMLRNNTPAAIDALMVPPVRVVVSDEKRPRPLVHTLRQGHDTLADALGDDVYLSGRVGNLDPNWLKVESPLTGRWVAVEERGGRLWCGELPIQVILDTEHEHAKWAKACAKDILAFNLPRYYLPRRWNETGGWISHEALASLYSQYQKEKADVSTK